MATTRPHHTGVEGSVLAAHRIPHQAQGVPSDVCDTHWSVPIISGGYHVADSHQ